MSLVTALHAAWLAVRWSVVVPTLQLGVYLCAAMSLMLFVERVYMGLIVAWLWLRRRRRDRKQQRHYHHGGGSSRRDADEKKAAELARLHSSSSVDLEAGALHRPVVLVQIPMFNEKQVYRLSIGAACGLSWPAEKLVIQVLDDSTDASIRALVEAECARWACASSTRTAATATATRRAPCARASRSTTPRSASSWPSSTPTSSAGAAGRPGRRARAGAVALRGASSTPTSASSRGSRRCRSTTTSPSSRRWAPPATPSSASTAPPASGASSAGGRRRVEGPHHRGCDVLHSC